MSQGKSYSLNKSKPLMVGNGVAPIARNTGYLLGGRGLTNVVRFVYAIVLARNLGPELYGVFNYGMSWYLAFLPLTGLGLGIILSREVGRDRIKGGWVVAQTLTLRTFIAIFSAIVCGVAGWFFEGGPEARRLLLVFSIALTGRSLALWAEHVFTAYEANKYFLQQQAIFRPLEVAFGLVLLLAGGGALAVATVHVISWWLQALRGLALIRRHIAAIRFDWAWRGLKSILAQGVPSGLGVVLFTWLLQGPIILFRYTAGTGNSLGQFTLAMQAFIILCNLPLAVGTAALPVLSRAVARHDGKDLLFVEIMLRASFILGAGASLVVIGAGPWLVDAILGARYGEAGHLLGLVMWLLIPWSCGNAIWRVYLARGQFFLPTMCAGAGALVLTFTMPWLVSAVGTSGALLATGGGIGVWALSLIGILIRSDDLDLGRVVLRPVGVVLLALAVFLVLLRVNVWLSLPGSLFVLGCGTFSLGVLTSDERSALLRLVGRRRGAPINDIDSTEEIIRKREHGL
jgi:O-antigen/teichoic acid export membrane protein